MFSVHLISNTFLQRYSEYRPLGSSFCELKLVDQAAILMTINIDAIKGIKKIKILDYINNFAKTEK